jgi:hypothetical protein
MRGERYAQKEKPTRRAASEFGTQAHFGRADQDIGDAGESATAQAGAIHAGRQGGGYVRGDEANH